MLFNRISDPSNAMTPPRPLASSECNAPRTRMLLCRAPGVQVLVDAAHGLGQQEVHVAALQADYVTGNCHKWLCGPRGSAVLWAAARHHARLRPLVVSHGHGHGFTSDFIWDGAPPLHADCWLRRCVLCAGRCVLPAVWSLAGWTMCG